MKTVDTQSSYRSPWFWLALFLSGAMSLLVLGCQPAPDEQVVPTEEEFTEFYHRFLNDEAFQLSRITFPLEGLPSGAEESDLQGFYWERADWQVHRPFDPAETGFETEFVDIGRDVMVERIVHRSGEYGMMRRFARLGGQWYLIYYAGLNAIES